MYKLLVIALALAGCTTMQTASSKYNPPTLKGRTVEWHYGSQADVDTVCKTMPQFTSMSSDMQSRSTVNGCFKLEHVAWAPDKCTIYTRSPSRGDGALMDALQHELAHCEGWVHPDYTD